MTVERIDNLYDDLGLSVYLSRADYYQIAGIAAIENGAENAGKEKVGI